MAYRLGILYLSTNKSLLSLGIKTYLKVSSLQSHPEEEHVPSLRPMALHVPLAKQNTIIMHASNLEHSA